MAVYRNHLPQLDATTFLTDGGLETTLVFDDGFELPDFAAFPLHETPEGRAAIVRYLESYAAIAVRDGVGIVLETATWRANPDWGARLGYDADALAAVNRDAVDLVLDVRRRLGNDRPSLVSMAGIANGRPIVIVATNERGREIGLKAGVFVRTAAQVLGGGGGGKDDIAQGGGTDTSMVSAALGAVEEQLRQRGA